MDVIEYLKNKDAIAYRDIIEPLEEGIGDILLSNEDGILIRVKGASYHVVIFNEQELARFLPLILKRDQPISIHDGALATYFKDQGTRMFLACNQAVYTSKERLELDDEVPIRPLTEADLQTVLDHYVIDDEEYILDRIRSGVMIGTDVDGHLAAFMGRHTEGAMGLLHVLPQFRRRHLGQALEKAYINRLLDEGRTPFCQVAIGNTASIELQKKLGLTFSDEIIYWFN